jgi:hypothetical protein
LQKKESKRKAKKKLVIVQTTKLVTPMIPLARIRRAMSNPGIKQRTGVPPPRRVISQDNEGDVYPSFPPVIFPFLSLFLVSCFQSF